MTKLNSRYSSVGAAMTPWFDAQNSLDEARIFWLATVRPDGQPHVTPLFSVWVDEALYFGTGEGERKAKNLAGNARCVILTGCNTDDGLDVVVEGVAVRITDEAKLRRVARKYASKYNWHYTVRDEALFGVGGKSLVFEVQPSTAFGFGKGDVFG
jgi:general stress protein 26